jgi:hypothetical protein
MRDAALATAAEYSLDNSSRKTYRIFRGVYERWREIKIRGGLTGALRITEAQNGVMLNK